MTTSASTTPHPTNTASNNDDHNDATTNTLKDSLPQKLHRRSRAFLLSNGVSIASALPSILLTASNKSNLLTTYLSTVFRLGLCAFVLTLKEPLGRRQGWDARSRHLAKLLTVAGPMEALMSSVALSLFAMKERLSWKRSVATFVPLLFAFEVLMDLGHYLAHRLMHASPTLYRLSGHKKHHTVAHPTPLSTYEQSVLDVLLSNVVPVLSALYAMDRFLGVRFTPTQLLIVFGYKTWIEVAGHLGDLSSHSTSFPACVWLPQALDIELRTRDHDLHHTHGGKHNFSKRFTLWDKVFGTFASL